MASLMLPVRGPGHKVEGPPLWVSSIRRGAAWPAADVRGQVDQPPHGLGRRPKTGSSRIDMVPGSAAWPSSGVEYPTIWQWGGVSNHLLDALQDGVMVVADRGNATCQGVRGDHDQRNQELLVVALIPRDDRGRCTRCSQSSEQRSPPDWSASGTGRSWSSCMPDQGGPVRSNALRRGASTGAGLNCPGRPRPGVPTAAAQGAARRQALAGRRGSPVPYCSPSRSGTTAGASSRSLLRRPGGRARAPC